MSTQEIVMIVAPMALLQLILMIVALVDIIRREPERIRGPKWAWMVAAAVFGMIGPIAYFVAGRKD